MTEEEKKELEQEVEETISEMKDRAAGLMKTAEEIADQEVGAKARELAEKVGESFEKTSAKLADSLQTAVDSDQVKKTIEYVRAKTDEISGYASEKLEELKKSDVVLVHQTFEQKGGTVKETALKVGEKINESLDQFKNSEAYKRVNEGFDQLKNSDAYKRVNEGFDNLKKTESYKRVADKVTDVAGSARDAFADFAEKNDLDTKIDRVKDTTIELAEKGVSALKRWLRPELYGKNKEEKK